MLTTFHIFVEQIDLKEMEGLSDQLRKTIVQLKGRDTSPAALSIQITHRIEEIGQQLNNFIFSQVHHDDFNTVMQRNLYGLQEVLNTLPNDTNYKKNFFTVIALYYYVLYGFIQFTIEEEEFIASSATILAELLTGLPAIPEFDISSFSFAELEKYLRVLNDLISIYCIASVSLDYVDRFAWLSWIQSALELDQKFNAVFTEMNLDKRLKHQEMSSKDYFFAKYTRYLEYNPFTSMLSKALLVRSGEDSINSSISANSSNNTELSIMELLQRYRIEINQTDDFKLKIPLLKKNIDPNDWSELMDHIQQYDMITRDSKNKLALIEYFRQQDGSISDAQFNELEQEFLVFIEDMHQNFGQGADIMLGPYANIISTYYIGLAQLYTFRIRHHYQNLEDLRSWTMKVETLLSGISTSIAVELREILLISKFIIVQHDNSGRIAIYKEAQEFLEAVHFRSRFTISIASILYLDKFAQQMILHQDLLELMHQLYTDHVLGKMGNAAAFKVYLEYLESQSETLPSELANRTKMTLDSRSWLYPQFPTTQRYVPFNLEYDMLI